MRLAFLGLGRMGRELAAHIIADGTYDVTVWNRTPSKAASCVELGAKPAQTAADAVRSAEIVVTCLFGPQSVQEVVLDSHLPWSQNTLWMDVSTVGPAMARQCAAWADDLGLAYVQAPVLGSLGPAKAGDLGVLIGSADADARAKARQLSSLWADPQRIVEYDEAGKAAAGKLLVNYGLAVGMQGLVEACRIGETGGMTPQEAVALAQLPKTPLSIIATMKGGALLRGIYTDTQFSANLLAKDVALMFKTADGEDLPALRAAQTSLQRACQTGHGEDDFSVMAVS